MAAPFHANEVFRLVGEREQFFREPDGDRVVVGAVHDQQRREDARDALVAAERIPHERPHREHPE
jgi:hypothetical protein